MKTWMDIYDLQIDPRTKFVGECIEFTGCIDTTGYGVITVKLENQPKRKMAVHRVTYLAYKGEIPNGLQVQHKCNNRRCCNEAHLIVGDEKANARHMVLSGHTAITSNIWGIQGVTRKIDRGGIAYWMARTNYVEGKYGSLYHGKDFFDACCARKSWESKQ